MEKIPVIIDTDPGIDDTLAILLAAASERLQVLGLTPVDGNVRAEHTFRNALDLADFIGQGWTVAKGADHQFRVPCFGRAEDVHGERGLGSVTLPASRRAFDPRPAWDYIYDEARAHSGALVVVAIGPLTDLALCLEAHPDVRRHLREIVLMGGSTARGNRTRYAEFNFWVDPAAADAVFRSGIPITMAGLDVTLRTGVPADYLLRLAAEKPSRISSILSGSASTYNDRAMGRSNEAVSIVHDAIPVFFAEHPEWCTAERCEITICTDPADEHYGQSLRSTDDPARFNTRQITGVDMDRYLSRYEHMRDYFTK